MKRMRLVAAFALSVLVLYTIWAAKLALFGHTISTIDTGGYVVIVDRVPWRFSWTAPVEGGRWFSGYIRIKLKDARGMEIGLYSVNWDSFYPDSATAVERHVLSDLDHIVVRLGDGTAYIRAEVYKFGDIKWGTLTK